MSSLPKALEGLTDVGAQLGDLKFVMSKVAPERKAAQAELTSQDRVRRAFVLQASLMFDAKEIKHLIECKKERLAVHVKTMCDRNIPWISDLILFMPGIITELKSKDPLLSREFVELNVGGALENEMVIIGGLVKKLQNLVEGEGGVAEISNDCDVLISVSFSLFHVFSKAKDAFGVKKAEGVI